MKVKSAIGECLVKMGKTNFVNKTYYSDEESELIDRLINALLIIYRQIVTSYLPRTCQEEVIVTNHRIEYSSLSNHIIYPISLYRGDSKEKFKSYYDRIEADFDGRAVLNYAFMPDMDITINSDIDDANLTQNALTNGILGEYYFEEKIFDLASSFDTDFRVEMDTLKLKGKNYRIKARRWQA